MKIKTKYLVGLALDWAVAKCEGMEFTYEDNPYELVYFNFSSDDVRGGPIILRERIAVWVDEEGGFLASADEGKGKDYHGPTYLIAAMRAYVASKMGGEIEMPVRLC
jgi:hypothetical protein